MMANVYYSREMTKDSIQDLFKHALKDMPEQISDTDKVAVKVHFGEKGNTRFVSPKNIAPVLDILKQKCKDVFLTDANTLYVGMRLNATDHKKIANEHGFGELGVPIVIADGEHGDEEENVEVNCPILKKVKIAKAIADASAMVTISHFKGHCLFGFGAAIKNLGMGCGSRAGKLEMHSKIKPSINGGKCVSCGACIKNCSVNAISFSNIMKKAKIDKEKCIGCAKCISACKFHAVMIPWGGNTSEEAQERCAEYALGAVKNKKCVYITFINNIAKDCDCAKDTEIIGEDVGIVASIDPVAADTAAFDLIVEQHGREIFKEATGLDGTHIFEHGERIGLGKRSYKLVKL